ncbi:MAG: flagellar hook-basal body complex protein FliE [Phyllobacterium sp.]
MDALLSATAHRAVSNVSLNGLAGGAGETAAAARAGATDMSFEAVLSQMVGSVSNKLGSAEALSMKSMTGDVPTREVVSAVMEAEQALQTAIAVRDKIVQSYLEISRMAI